MKKVTIYDVAERAHVSPSTVSRVINQNSYVKEETRQAVALAIKEVGYYAAKEDKIKRLWMSRIVGVLVPDIRDEHCAEVVFYLEQELSLHGYICFLCNANGSYEKAIHDMELLMQRKASCLVLVNSFFTEQPIADWLKEHTDCPPVVTVYGGLQLPNVYSIQIDIESGHRITLERFVAKGKTKIAFIQSRTIKGSYLQKKVFQKMAKEKLHDEHPVCAMTEDISIRAGEVITQRLLEKYPYLNGMIFESCLPAIGATRACAEMGIPVPEGIGICCSDMVKYSEIVHPAVACADIKQDMMGREAARTVIDLLEGRGRPRKLLISVDRIFTRDTM